MKGFQVWYKEFEVWNIDSAANGVNLIYAECIAEYHRSRGHDAKIINLDAV